MIIVSEEGRVVADRVETARTFWKRLLGLMLRREFLPGSALVLEPCNAVHTFFVRFPVRLLYVARDGTVLRNVVREPWRLGPVVKGARLVVELPAGEKTSVKKVIIISGGGKN